MKPIRVPPRIRVAPTSSAGPNLEPCQTLACTVTGVRAGEVQVRFEGGTGVIGATEFPAPPAAGAQVQAWVWGQDPEDGATLLSTRTPVAQLDWDRMQAGDLVEGRVVEVAQTGIRLDVQGARGFIPSARLERGLNATVLLRKPLRAEVLDFNRKKKELTLGRTGPIDQRRQRRQAERFARYQRGETVEGTVVRVNEHGAFIDLGGVDGLLHVSKIERRQRELGEQPLAIEPGVRVRVEILSVEPERGRIGLGLPREAAPLAGARISEEYQIGESVMGLVQRVDHLGAYVMLDEGVTALVPAAGTAHWDEPLRRGNVVRARVVAIDPRTHRIELAAEPPTPGTRRPATDEAAEGEAES